MLTSFTANTKNIAFAERYVLFSNALRNNGQLTCEWAYCWETHHTWSTHKGRS